MDDIFIRPFMAINTLVIRASRGRIGSRLGTQTILLLHTVGRKSGRHVITPIAYFQLEDFYFLIGSNWGRDWNAAWYHNLLAQPHTKIEVKGQTIHVAARMTQGAEYDRLWDYATSHHPPYLRYKEMTQRHIPIVVLQPEQ